MVACLGALPALGETPVALQVQAVNLSTLGTVNSNATVQATVHHPIGVPPGCTMVIQPLLSAAGVGTSNTTFSFSGTLDGITWTTATNPYPVTGSLPCNGTNLTSAVVAVATNLPYRMVSFDAITTTQTNPVTVKGMKVLFLPTSVRTARRGDPVTGFEATLPTGRSGVPGGQDGQGMGADARRVAAAIR